jgi:hypothetical protein
MTKIQNNKGVKSDGVGLGCLGICQKSSIISGVPVQTEIALTNGDLLATRNISSGSDSHGRIAQYNFSVLHQFTTTFVSYPLHVKQRRSDDGPAALRDADCVWNWVSFT